MSKETPEEAEVFAVCSDANCPRDIRFHCESLMNYENLEITKQKPIKPQLAELVQSLLTRHYIELVDPSACNSAASNFTCILCNNFFKNVRACLKHLLESCHQCKEADALMKFTQQNLPEPSEEHLISLDRSLETVLTDFGISDQEISRRKQFVAKLNEEFKGENLDFSLLLHGSSITSLGFQHSDINITIISNKSSPEALNLRFPSAEENEAHSKIISFFQNHPKTINFSPNVINKTIVIKMTDDEDSHMDVCLSKGNKSAVKLSNLLSAYVNLNPVVRPLILALRLWAKLVELDDKSKGGLPPYAWASLVIFFLQKSMVLPVLNPAAVTEDGGTSSNNIVTPGYLGSLWIQMLRFYTENLDKFVISITGDSALNDITGKPNIVTIQDAFPEKPGKNCKIESSIRMFEYISKMFTSALLYFGIPRTCQGPLYNFIFPAGHEDKCSPVVFHQVTEEESSGGLSTTKLDIIDDPKWDPLNLAFEVKGQDGRDSLLANPVLKLESVKVRMFVDHLGKACVMVDDAILLGQLFPEWLYEYKFDKEKLPGDCKPPIFCVNCDSRQHFAFNCDNGRIKQEFAFPVPAEIPMSNYKIINEAILANYDNEALTDHHVMIREDIRFKLREAISRFFPGAFVAFFGSSVNGFGTRTSDLDVSVFLSDEEVLSTPQAVVMSKLQKSLYRRKDFRVVYFIRHARIPIVKFKHIDSNLDGDLSSSNPLAVRNSSLLRLYCEIDPRVKIIGLFWKKMMKVCDIGSVAKGGLSSYGFSLMLIHFFQHMINPVLPVLQEINLHELQPAEIDGWDVRYYSDIHNLKSVWPQYGQNRSSLAELWLQLLEYYTDTFDFENHVVTIRQSAPLTKISKFWISDSLISVEDPFQLSHNIGDCLSRKNSIRILLTIQKVRQVFLSHLDSAVLQTEEYKDWLSYFTDPNVVQLSAGKKRKCSTCGQCGYHNLDCVERKKVRLNSETNVKS